MADKYAQVEANRGAKRGVHLVTQLDNTEGQNYPASDKTTEKLGVF